MVALDSNERATTRPITEQRETHARRTNSCTQLQSFFGSGTKLSTRQNLPRVPQTELYPLTSIPQRLPTRSSLTSSRPDAILATMPNPIFLLPPPAHTMCYAAASQRTSTATCVRQESYSSYVVLLFFSFLDIKYCGDTRPASGQQLKVAQRQHADFCKLISRSCDSSYRSPGHWWNVILSIPLISLNN
eukprot:1137956-Pelagomonas_calceolata.AAC.1